MKIIWTHEAETDYHRNLIYLSENWPETVSVDFVLEVNQLLNSIQIHPDLFPLINHKKVRKAVLKKQISLYYKVENQNIYLIRFWNNYQNPDLLKI